MSASLFSLAHLQFPGNCPVFQDLLKFNINSPEIFFLQATNLLRCFSCLIQTSEQDTFRSLHTALAVNQPSSHSTLIGASAFPNPCLEGRRQMIGKRPAVSSLEGEQVLSRPAGWGESFSMWFLMKGCRLGKGSSSNSWDSSSWNGEKDFSTFGQLSCCSSGDRLQHRF